MLVECFARIAILVEEDALKILTSFLVVVSHQPYSNFFVKTRGFLLCLQIWAVTANLDLGQPRLTENSVAQPSLAPSLKPCSDNS